MPALSIGYHFVSGSLGFEELTHANFAQVKTFVFSIIILNLGKFPFILLVHLGMDVVKLGLLSSLEALNALLGIVERRVDDG